MDWGKPTLPERYLNTIKKTNLGKIDLELLRKFYVEFICSYEYKFELEDNTVLKVNFEENHLPHLLGLHKLRATTGKKATDIIEEIKDGRLNLKDVKESDNNSLKKISDRLCFFPTIETVLNFTTFIIEFDALKCIPTKLDCSFLLKSEKINVTVYLGIRETDINSKELTCFPVTFLVDRVNQFKEEKQNVKKVISLTKRKI